MSPLKRCHLLLPVNCISDFSFLFWNLTHCSNLFRPGFVIVHNYSRLWMRQFSFGGRLTVSHVHALLTAAGHSSLSSAVAYEDSSALVIYFYFFCITFVLKAVSSSCTLKDAWNLRVYKLESIMYYPSLEIVCVSTDVEQMIRCSSISVHSLVCKLCVCGRFFFFFLRDGQYIEVHFLLLASYDPRYPCTVDNKSNSTLNSPTNSRNRLGTLQKVL